MFKICMNNVLVISVSSEAEARDIFSGLKSQFPLASLRILKDGADVVIPRNVREGSGND